MPVHGSEEGGRAFHALHHLLIGAHGLDAERYGLQLGAHGVEFLYVSGNERESCVSWREGCEDRLNPSRQIVWRER